MNTTSLHNLFRFLATATCLIALGLAAGCQKSCQPAATQSYQHLRDTPWRLVSTTDPSPVFSQNLSNTTFLIMEFTIDFKGDVKQVQNNDEYNTPLYNLEYNQDPQDNIVVIQYTPTDQSSNAGSSTVQYTYNLSTTLDLRDMQHGYTYHFVPFMGVVDPGDTCTF